MYAQTGFGALCGSILNLSKSIQYVVIINKLGRPVEKLLQSSYTREFPDYMNEMLCMQCVLQISMGKDFDEQCGPINYHISERENLTMLTFPIDDHVILVSIKKSVSPISLARKIVNVINSRKSQPVNQIIT